MLFLDDIISTIVIVITAFSTAIIITTTILNTITISLILVIIVVMITSLPITNTIINTRKKRPTHIFLRDHNRNNASRLLYVIKLCGFYLLKDLIFV